MALSLPSAFTMIFKRGWDVTSNFVDEETQSQRAWGPGWLMNTGLVRSLGLCSLQGPFLGFQTPPVSGFSDPSSSMWAWLLLLSSSLH